TSATQRRTLPLGAFALPSCACTRAPTRGAPTSSSLPATSPVGDVGSQPTSTSSPFEGEYRCPSAPVRVVLPYHHPRLPHRRSQRPLHHHDPPAAHRFGHRTPRPPQPLRQHPVQARSAP